jgi:hypothetical protein
MTTHTLTAPEKAGVTRWLFDPSDQDVTGGRHFNRKTGTWRNRGHKKWCAVLRLVDVDEEGNRGYYHESIAAPADGYVEGLPTEKRYFTPGETIAVLREGYVYHWWLHDRKAEKRGARARAVTYRNFPRVRYGVNLGIAALIGIVGYLLTLIGWEFTSTIGALMVIGSVPYGFFSGLLLILGKQRGHRFLENWFQYRPFWQGFYGLVGFGLASLIGYELAFGNGFVFGMIPWGFLSFMAIDAMFAGAWGRGPVFSRFGEFVSDRIFRRKENEADS